MRKIIKVCVLLLIGLLTVLIGKQFIAGGNLVLMASYYVLSAVFFYLIPIAFFRQDSHRLVGFVLEVLLGFMLFLWLYLDVVSEIKGLSDISWAKLLMFDGAVLVATGFGGALYYSASTQKQFKK